MKSPSQRDANNSENRPARAVLMMPPLVPFPDLPSCIGDAPTRSRNAAVSKSSQLPNNKKKTMKKRLRHQDQVVPSPSSSKIKIKESDDNTTRTSMPEPEAAATSTNNTSAPISLPNSHIHRTPSELRLEALTIRAERQDVRMYSRLLGGMQHQIENRCHVSGGEGHGVGVHPLSRKSMQGIMTTKLANGEQEDQNDDTSNRACDVDDDGWDVSYAHIAEENEPLVDSSPTKGLKDSLTKLTTDSTTGGGQEDDCVFSMEL